MISLSSQNWSKIKKPVSQSVQRPVGRFAQAASHITGPVFLMSGGYNGFALSDVWLCDTNQWIKVFHLNRPFRLRRCNVGASYSCVIIN